MGLFKKNSDPLSQRSRELKEQISSLEAKIKKLSSQVEQTSGPRIRSTTLPSGQAALATPIPLVEAAPIFEDVEQSRLKSQTEMLVKPEYYNELGVRKFDLPGLLRRLQNNLRPTTTTANAKLVTFLAAGSVQGLRPLRYEKRVARNRFIVFFSICLVILWGLAAVFFRR